MFRLGRAETLPESLYVPTWAHSTNAVSKLEGCLNMIPPSSAFYRLWNCERDSVTGPKSPSDGWEAIHSFNKDLVSLCLLASRSGCSVNTSLLLIEGMTHWLYLWSRTSDLTMRNVSSTNYLPGTLESTNLSYSSYPSYGILYFYRW